MTLEGRPIRAYLAVGSDPSPAQVGLGQCPHDQSAAMPSHATAISQSYVVQLCRLSPLARLQMALARLQLHARLVCKAFGRIVERLGWSLSSSERLQYSVLILRVFAVLCVSGEEGLTIEFGCVLGFWHAPRAE